MVEANNAKTQTTTVTPTKLSIMHSKWKLSFVFLIVVGLSIECVNITIAYKYETENDVTSSLQVFQTDPRTNLLRTVRDDGIASTAAPSQNKFRLEASDS